jgi:hypothetical protein
MEWQAPKPQEEAQAEELAKLYEYLVLYDIAVPGELVEAMRSAFRRVHRRGLDPLRIAA